MNKKTLLIFFILIMIYIMTTEGKKSTRSRSSGSGRGSSRKNNYSPQPVPPTSFSHAQPASAPKPSLFGWQEKSAQRTQQTSIQSKPSNTHSYPSSQTGLSGGSPQKIPPGYQENIQKNNAQHSQSPSSHSYPSSNGLSGKPNSGYPAQPGNGHAYPGAASPANGLSGNKGVGTGYPSQQGHSYPAPAPPQNTGMNIQRNNAMNHPTNYNQPPPPYYSNVGPGYGGYGGHGGHSGGYGSQMPGYFGNAYTNSYGNRFGSVGRRSNILTGVGIAGAGVGTILTGLALWNLARSTGHHHHTVIYDNRGQPVAVSPSNNTELPVADSILGDLVNCTLTISSNNATEVLQIPCAIATSFSPDADIKDVKSDKEGTDNTKCTITVVTKELREFMTTIPCSILLHSAAENNVTEPPILNNGTDIIAPYNGTNSDQQTSQMLADSSFYQSAPINVNCSIVEAGQERDPINPCFAVANNLTVIPLNNSDHSTSVP